MPGRRPNRSTDDMLRATWELQRDIEDAFKVYIMVEWRRVQFQRGTYQIRYLAWPAGMPVTEPPRWSYTRNYPNETTDGLPACLFVSLVRFEQQLASVPGLREANLAYTAG